MSTAGVAACDGNTPRVAEPSQPAPATADSAGTASRATTTAVSSMAAASSARTGIDHLVSKPLPNGFVLVAVVVDDGGDCYFQLTFDPTAQRITRMTVNGEA